MCFLFVDFLWYFFIDLCEFSNLCVIIVIFGMFFNCLFDESVMRVMWILGFDNGN